MPAAAVAARREPPAPFAKVLVLVNGLVPAAMLAWDAIHGHLGANPIEFVTRTTGLLTLVFLVGALLVTPARQLLGLPWLGKLRRMLGLYTFFYATLHLLTYLWLDQFFAVGPILQDVFTRPFILLGMAAYALMVPMAVTSTDRMIRRVGGKRWAAIHRRVYVVAVLAVVHYWLLVKADKSGPLGFAIVFFFVLGYRFVPRSRKRPTVQ